LRLFLFLRMLRYLYNVQILPNEVPGDGVRHQLHSLPYEFEDEENPFFFVLSCFIFNQPLALALCGGLEFLDDTLEGEQ
jgi:hypothetical protein